MKIKRAKETDAEALDEAIKTEFPYTFFTPEKISEKIKSPNFLILTAWQGNICTGFIEVELLGREARLNGVYVEEAWRGQKIATQLIQKAIHECKRKHIGRVFLLVREGNEGAKELYKKTGFKFEKMHDREIDGNKVEVWSANT
jgi:ribosomal protein S18 acetylase RimI-like enzyme